jgi:hypothetical protein
LPNERVRSNKRVRKLSTEEGGNNKTLGKNLYKEELFLSPMREYEMSGHVARIVR